MSVSGGIFRGFTIPVAVFLSLSACTNSVSVPAGGQDHAPVIKINSYPVGGTGDVDCETVDTSAPVTVTRGTEIMILGAATNPGGVKEFSLTVNQGTKTLYDVKATAVIGSDGKVPDLLSIPGSNGAGGVGNTPLDFTETGETVSVTSTATNFNNQTTTSTVDYRLPIDATWVGHLSTWNTRGDPENGPFTMQVRFIHDCDQWKMHVSTFAVDIGEKYALQSGQIGSGSVNGDHATLKLPLHGSGYVSFDLPLDLSTDATIQSPYIPSPQSGIPYNGSELDMVGQGMAGHDTFWAAFRGTIDAWPSPQ